MFLLSYFFISVEEDGITLGVLLRDDTGHKCEEGTCVLLCLDVSFIFFMKLLAVIA